MIDTCMHFAHEERDGVLIVSAEDVLVMETDSFVEVCVSVSNIIATVETAFSVPLTISDGSASE